MAQAAKGTALMEQGKFDEAIQQFTLALKSSPTSPDYYIKRSMAHQRKSLADNEAALQDAEYAVVAAVGRARRELICKGQMRRAISLFNLGKYPDSQFLFSVVKGMHEKEPGLSIWEVKVNAKVQEMKTAEKDITVTVEKIPKISLPEPEREKKAEKKSEEQKTEKKAVKTEQATTAPTSAAPKSPPVVQQTPADKIKHDWYQSSDTVYLTLLAKGVPKDKATVEIEADSVSISFPTATGSSFEYSIDPLFEKIDPAASSYTITPSKVEFSLKKTAASQWRALEGEHVTPAAESGASNNAADEEVKKAVLQLQGPVYPSSSKTGPKNWDKVVDDIDVEKEGDDVNNFFQMLYKGADADTQRAMMKSYQESNGTVLSTNWGEVGKGKVETSPPDGMVAKKWGE